MLTRKHLEKKVLFLWKNPCVVVFICHIIKKEKQEEK